MLGFNLGVELGQLLVVALLLPLAFALRETGLYRLGAVRLGSTAIAALAALWLVERT
nr:HupE/UreJ family protein [Caldimonas tepidiphila]